MQAMTADQIAIVEALRDVIYNNKEVANALLRDAIYNNKEVANALDALLRDTRRLDEMRHLIIDLIRIYEWHTAPSFRDPELTEDVRAQIHQRALDAAMEAK